MPGSSDEEESDESYVSGKSEFTCPHEASCYFLDIFWGMLTILCMFIPHTGGKVEWGEWRAVWELKRGIHSAVLKGLILFLDT